MLPPIAATLGAGSGIDTVALVRDLAAASRAPKVERFDALTRANQAKISAVARARSDLDSFAVSPWFQTQPQLQRLPIPASGLAL
jgi:flagellar hook-associated protein 2